MAVKKTSLANRIIKYVGIILFFFIIIGSASAYWVYDNFQPVELGDSHLIEVEIPMGSSSVKIAEILYENELIKNKRFFYYFVRYHGGEGFQAGTYYLTKEMSPEEIMLQLEEGKLYTDSTRFTIPEGLTIVQIAERLASQGFVDKEKFLKAVNEGDFSEFDIVNEIPASEDREYRLEGFLFPETYDIRKNATEEEIIKLMLIQMENEIKDEWKEDIKNSSLSFYEIMTLASIIERETVTSNERHIVAGVYYNRLAEGMLLQADATIQFALGEQKERLLYSDLEFDTPYNSYKHIGLPPSPIAVSGRESIEAAIYPEETEYFFYVTKKDGTGEHYFSITYSEHLNNIAKSRQD